MGAELQVLLPNFTYTKVVKFFMITRNGICYDFNISNYRITIGELTYVFSSQLHLDKFKAKLKDNRKAINRSLTNRFNLDVDVSELADIILYKKIETRGFLIVTNEGTELWQTRNIQFVGGKATPQNFNEQ